MNKSKMKAVVCSAYGSADVLSVLEIDIPKCQDNEILIEVVNASINTAEAMMRKGEPKYARLFLGCKKPKNPIIGTGFSGVVTEKGKLVTNFKIGDEVYGETGVRFSSNAQYISMHSEDVVLQKPKEISFEKAAVMCDGVLTSYNFLKNIAKAKAGEKILIIGTSGSLGVAAVQLSKALKMEVTGVCSGNNLDLVHTLGADFVLDYNVEDFSTLKVRYDIIYDTIGVSSFAKCKNVLNENGLYMCPVLNGGLLLRMILNPILGKKKAYFQATGLKNSLELKEMLNKVMSIVSLPNYNFVLKKAYGLNQIKEAHKLIDTGRKVGNLVLKLKY